MKPYQQLMQMIDLLKIGLRKPEKNSANYQAALENALKALEALKVFW